jgi:outer membrane protein assembly factor BamE (lipoprotein component of BamABCDE complex)
MQQRVKSHVLACAGLMFSLAVGGCGNVSKVDGNGQAALLVWPDLTQATRSKGSYPDPHHLAMIKPGMDKDQLYDLLGRPHFHEGFLMVREWDYLFHVRTPTGDELCQYKVLFDRDRTVRSVHWRTPSCEAAIKKSISAAAHEAMQADANGARSSMTEAA